ncbi:MAG: hypothetical protein HOP11_10110, partial [Saprospiraceae bacterium]|nr:hypothetical protein [Saprospiraceae bacterium]
MYTSFLTRLRLLLIFSIYLLIGRIYSQDFNLDHKRYTKDSLIQILPLLDQYSMEYRIKLVDSIQYHANNLINSRKYFQAFEYAILCDALFEYYKSYPYAQTINNNYLKGLSLANFGRYAKGDSLLLVALDSSIKYYSENSLEVAKVGKVLGFTKHF